MLIRLLKKYRIELAFAAAGALAGYLYWYYVGCLSGTCPIKSNPFFSTLYGALLGIFLGGMVKDFFHKRKEKRGV